MASRKQKVIAGLFIVAAVSLLVTTVALIEHWGEENPASYRVVFEPEMSVSGLGPSSRVKFKGVPIGQVREVVLESAAAGLVRAVAVIEVTGDANNEYLSHRVRAQLVLNGITGTKSIDLSELPVEEGGKEAALDAQWRRQVAPEIPARAGQLDRVLDRMPGLVSDVAGVADRVDELSLRVVTLLDDVGDILDRNGGRISHLLASLDAALGEGGPRLLTLLERGERVLSSAEQRLLAPDGVLDRLEASVDRNLGGLSQDVSRAADRVAGDVSRTLASTERPVTDALGNLEVTLEAMRAALDEVRVMAREMNGLVAGNRAAFELLVVDVRDASDAFEKLMVELKNHPGSLLWGAPRPDRGVGQ